jgi:tRNA G18 (ribose-2'-O)-methylase SpoU
MTSPTPISDPDDPRIESYRAVRERDLVGRADRFIAEGEVVLKVLATQSRFAIDSLLLAENRTQGLADLIAGLPPSVPVYVASRPVIDAIAGFPIHRGVLALGHRGPAVEPAHLLASLPHRALVVGLVGLTNHDNVGGIFRNAAAFGADAVLLDSTTCDPLYRKAIRVSVGGSLTVPFSRAGAAPAMVAGLEEAGFEVFSLSPAGREPLAGVARSPRTALLLGAEGPGLPQSLLARTRTVAIPMKGGFDSLNVSTASGIALHHLAGTHGGQA